jgi:hypothetical protein
VCRQEAGLGHHQQRRIHFGHAVVLHEGVPLDAESLVADLAM